MLGKVYHDASLAQQIQFLERERERERQRERGIPETLGEG